MSWTDEQIIPYTTKIRSVHIRELREALQQFHKTYTPGGHANKRIIWEDNDSACLTANESGLPPSNQIGIIDQVTTVKKSHIQQLRDILDTYANKQGCSGFDWTDPNLSHIKAIHIIELRNAIDITRARGALNCSSCETNYELDPCASACQATCETNPCQTCETNSEEYACKSTCQISCQATCQICESCDETGCEVGCEVSCESYCENTCQTPSQKKGCEGCNETRCENDCQTVCEISCLVTCMYFCELVNQCGSCQTQSQCGNCEASCMSDCQRHCMTTCQVGCEEGCEVISCQTCMKSCENCEVCQVGCEDFCETVACQTTCEIYCQNLCQIVCMPCQTSCQLSCQDACENSCQTCMVACETRCLTCAEGYFEIV